MPTPVRGGGGKRVCSHCGHGGHRVESCSQLAAQMLSLIKRRHASKAISSFVKDASQGNQGCNVQGMEGIHGNGKRRAKLIGTNIQNKTKRQRQKASAKKLNKARVQRQECRRVRRQATKYLQGCTDQLRELDSANFQNERLAFQKLCSLGWAKKPKKCPECLSKMSALTERCTNSLGTTAFFRCRARACHRWWSCLQFTFLKGTYRGLNLQQLLLILQTVYSIHPERHGRAPAYHTLCKSLGCKWANSSKLTRKILQESRLCEFLLGYPTRLAHPPNLPKP